MPKKDDNLRDYQVNELKENYETLNDKVDKILTNHLPHLQADIANMRSEQKIESAAIRAENRAVAALNISVIIIGIIISKILK